MSTSPVVKTSFFDKLTNSIYLDYVLKVLGIVMFGLAFFKAWHLVPFFTKFLFVGGPIAWYVGDKFNKIYK